MDQEFGKDSHQDGSDLGSFMQCSQVVTDARRAGGRSSWGIFLSLCHLGVSPWGLSCRLHWPSSQHGCLRLIGLLHNSSGFQWNFFFFFYLMFIYLFLRDREKEREKETERDRKRHRERDRQREAENPKLAPHHQRRAWHGARTHEPWDHDLSWNQVGRLTYWANQKPQEKDYFKCNYLLPQIKEEGHFECVG